LAGGAVLFGDLEMTAADVVDALTRSIRDKEQLAEHTCCMQRMGEKEIERGEGALVSLRGNRRHIAPQLLTGAMSRSGLRTLLEMLGEEGHGTNQNHYSPEDDPEDKVRLSKYILNCHYVHDIT
jgi:hypothetical protein